MIFTHCPPNIKWPKVKRKNINGVRHYVDEEYNIYHSVTRVVNYGKDFSGWHKQLSEQYKITIEQAEAIAEYVKINAGIIGTQLHSHVEDYLNNKIQPYDQFGHGVGLPLILQGHCRNIKWMLDKIDNIRGQEVQMFSKKLGLAGTVDCVADFKQEETLEHIPCIIDFKTSRKLKREEWIDSYFLQATAYSLMWEENTGEHIPNIKILMTAETGESGVFSARRNDWEDKLYQKIEEFKRDNNI